MPELPDVEVLKQYLDATALHQEIEQVKIFDSQILSDISANKLREALQHRTFESTRRHGKYLFTRLNNSQWLVLHFGMTGDLKYYKDSDTAPEYTQLLLDFTNEYHLAYIAPRKLGGIDLIEEVEGFLEQKELGPDVLTSDFDFSAFQEVLTGRRAMIKTALMNQQIMAGIGNVYSDEILFQARIHPKIKVNQLNQDDLQEIFHQIKEVLQTAIEHRARPDQFPASYLIPHRQPDASCPQCGGEVKRIEVSGRGAYYCPNCQKA